MMNTGSLFFKRIVFIIYSFTFCISLCFENINWLQRKQYTDTTIKPSSSNNFGLKYFSQAKTQTIIYAINELGSSERTNSTPPIREHSYAYGVEDLFPNQKSGASFEYGFNADDLWQAMRQEAEEKARQEPLLVSFYYSTILNHRSLESSLAFHMANKLASPSIISTDLYKIFMEALEADESFRRALREDIRAVRERDPACTSATDALLYFKGFQALQTHRVAHWLWTNQRQTLAHFLQSQVSEKFQIDIHPGAQIGSGMFIDHGHAIVVGETAVIGNNVSMLHQVTLGGSGTKDKQRHPKIGDNVLIGAGTSILGPVNVGKGVQIGACSLVLQDIPDNCVAVGVPAKILGATKVTAPSLLMRHNSIVESDGAGI
mmetsp:Transcript_6283/g.8215  ORF Transcript_6283/g.8215 Transcript_6283/m.8215 type:complete len:375 (+) Transcript_6283:131-1255(+)